MAQVAQFEATTNAASQPLKAYALTFKGLIRHALDILFVRQEKPVVYVSDLSEHMRRDVGL